MTTSNQILVTGNSSGLGLALTRACLQKGHSVFGMSRRGCPDNHNNLHDRKTDLLNHGQITDSLEKLLTGQRSLQLVFLNAGILGPIQTMPETTVDQLRHIMEINVWANKVILDWLHASDIQIDQIILVSSGAAISGRHGWSGYALSKASLNMLASLYAHDFPQTHICPLAPGIFDSSMQGSIRDPALVDAERFSSFQGLRQAKASGAMPTADEAAALIYQSLGKIRQAPSGDFQDIRNLA